MLSLKAVRVCVYVCMYACWKVILEEFQGVQLLCQGLLP